MQWSSETEAIPGGNMPRLAHAARPWRATKERAHVRRLCSVWKKTTLLAALLLSAGAYRAFPAEPSFLRLPGIPLVQGNQDKQRAKESIPWQFLNEEETQRVRKVVQASSVYRRLPDQTIQSEVDLYDFLLKHPEVVVDMWRVMGVTKATLTPTGPNTFTANDGAGTTCDIEVLHQDSQLLLLHTRGKYEGPLYHRPLLGDCVLLLTSTKRQVQTPEAQTPEAQGAASITISMDAFVKLHQVTVELIARTLKPVFGRISDHNFAETASFLGSVSQTARENPTGMLQLAEKLPTVSPEVRREYESILLTIAERAEAAEELPTLETVQARRPFAK